MHRHRISVVIVAALAAAFAALPAIAAPAAAAEAGDAVPPVLWQAPSCDHDKLGQVAIQVGNRVSETTRDLLVPTVDYAAAFAALATAAQAKGADAVVVRWHQATYFTRNGRRTRRPVHVQLRGAAIGIHADARPCDLALADPAAFAERAASGEAVNVGSGDAYGE